eukprot:8026594-Karenia_brevis.AAC.1
MALESAPYFNKRVKELGLSEHLATMQGLGWSTMGAFAFSANYVPGGADEKPFIDEVVAPILGEEAHPLKAALRRLFFDAYAM